MIICETAVNCTGVYHPQCLPNRDHENTARWACKRCTSPPPSDQAVWIEPLTPQELRLVRNANNIRTASDGPVRPDINSSTFGIVITDGEGKVLARRAIHFKSRPDDQSSYCSEMEALTGAYILLPEDIHSDHTTDSESVMDLHTVLVHIKTLPLTR